MSPEETAGSVEMALGMWGAVGPSNHVLNGGSGSTHDGLSPAAFLHYCTGPDVPLGNCRGCPLVVH